MRVEWEWSESGVRVEWEWSESGVGVDVRDMDMNDDVVMGRAMGRDMRV